MCVCVGFVRPQSPDLLGTDLDSPVGADARLTRSTLGEIGGRRVVHGRHTITLFRRPRTVHLEAGGLQAPSSVCRRRRRRRRAGLMARLSTVDGRPMEVGVDHQRSSLQCAVHDRGFRSLARKTDRWMARRAINATGHAALQVPADRARRTDAVAAAARTIHS